MRQWIFAILAALCVTARASDSDYAYRIDCELQTAGADSLDTLTWQQGVTPLIGLRVLRNGKPVTADTNTTVRFIFGPSATNTYYVVTTNTASMTTGSYYYVQHPTVGTNTAGAAWWYTVYFERSGYRYWTGNGEVYIEASTSTSDGLTWQTITDGGLASVGFGLSGAGSTGNPLLVDTGLVATVTDLENVISTQAVYSAIVDGISNRVDYIEAWPTGTWTEAYGWGDHGAAGYAGTGTVAEIDGRVTDVEAWPTSTWSEAYGWVSGVSNDVYWMDRSDDLDHTHIRVLQAADTNTVILSGAGTSGINGTYTWGYNATLHQYNYNGGLYSIVPSGDWWGVMDMGEFRWHYFSHHKVFPYEWVINSPMGEGIGANPPPSGYYQEGTNTISNLVVVTSADLTAADVRVAAATEANQPVTLGQAEALAGAAETNAVEAAAADERVRMQLVPYMRNAGVADGSSRTGWGYLLDMPTNALSSIGFRQFAAPQTATGMTVRINWAAHTNDVGQTVAPYLLVRRLAADYSINLDNNIGTITNTIAASGPAQDSYIGQPAIEIFYPFSTGTIAFSQFYLVDGGTSRSNAYWFIDASLRWWP